MHFILIVALGSSLSSRLSCYPVAVGFDRSISVPLGEAVSAEFAQKDHTAGLIVASGDDIWKQGQKARHAATDSI